jgi:hypothetical protein
MRRGLLSILGIIATGLFTEHSTESHERGDEPESGRAPGQIPSTDTV